MFGSKFFGAKHFQAKYFAHSGGLVALVNAIMTPMRGLWGSI